MQTWRDDALPRVSASDLGVEGSDSCSADTDAALLGVEVDGGGSCSDQSDACPTSSESSAAAHSSSRSASGVTSLATVSSSSVT